MQESSFSFNDFERIVKTLIPPSPETAGCSAKAHPPPPPERPLHPAVASRTRIAFVDVSVPWDGAIAQQSPLSGTQAPEIDPHSHPHTVKLNLPLSSGGNSLLGRRTRQQGFRGSLPLPTGTQSHDLPLLIILTRYTHPTIIRSKFAPIPSTTASQTGCDIAQSPRSLQPSSQL